MKKEDFEKELTKLIPNEKTKFKVLLLFTELSRDHFKRTFLAIKDVKEVITSDLNDTEVYYREKLKKEV